MFGPLEGIALTVVFVASCATAGVVQFQEFSNDGVAYADAANALLDEAARAAIDTDSSILVSNRAGVSTEERRQVIIEHNRLLRERVALLEDLKRHTGLLRSYFVALGALAKDKEDAAIQSSTENFVQALGRLNPRISTATILGKPIASRGGALANVVVRGVRSARLQRELAQHGGLIERELDLHRAAMSAVGEQLRADLQIQMQRSESQEVVLPFVRDQDLPVGWTEARRRTLTVHRLDHAAEVAINAATELESTFVRMMEGGSDLRVLSRLVEDLGRLLDLDAKEES